jgi:hypothetical protein
MGMIIAVLLMILVLLVLRNRRRGGKPYDCIGKTFVLKKITTSTYVFETDDDVLYIPRLRK